MEPKTGRFTEGLPTIRLSEQFRWPWLAEDRCPCGSGHTYGSCCLGYNGRPHVKVTSVVPPGELTDFAHPKCFLQATRNCSQRISREHYVSAAVLDQFEQPSVSGMPWQKPGEAAIYGRESLTARVLCERHNNALSPLDAHGATTVRHLKSGFAHATKRSLSARPSVSLASGPAFEAWGYKVAAGFFEANIARFDGLRAAGTLTDKHGNLAEALSGILLSPPAGIYVRAHEGDGMGNSISFAPIMSEDAGIPAGISMYFCAFEFAFVFEIGSSNPAGLLDLGFAYRPFRLTISGRAHGSNRAQTSHLFLSWPGTPASATGVRVTLS